MPSLTCCTAWPRHFVYPWITRQTRQWGCIKQKATRGESVTDTANQQGLKQSVWRGGLFEQMGLKPETKKKKSGNTKVYYC